MCAGKRATASDVRTEQALAAVEELPLSLREAFVLHVIEQFDCEAVQHMCRASQATLRVRVHLAKHYCVKF